MSDTATETMARQGAGPLPQANRLAVRMASFGILAVLLALGACALWGAATTYRADHAVKRATEASNAIEQVRKGIIIERSVRRTAGPNPGEEARARHREASSLIQNNLQNAHTFTEAVDRRLIDDLTARHAQYLLAAGNAWGEPSDPSLPALIFAPAGQDSARAEAVLSTLEADADQVAERLRVEALSLLQLLVEIQTRVFIGGPALFALGLLLVGAIWRMQRGEQRRGTTQLVQNAYAASREERRLRGVVQSAPEPMLICAGPGNVFYHNTAVEQIWGYQAEQIVGQSILMLAHPDDRAALSAWWEQLRPAAAMRAGEATRRMELRFRDASGGWRPAELIGTNLLDDQTVQGMVLTIRAVEARPDPVQLQVENTLLDPLTRLPNQVLLRDRLSQALARAGRRMDKVGLLLIGLDGLPAGDAPMLEAATRIQAWRAAAGHGGPGGAHGLCARAGAGRRHGGGSRLG